MNNNCSKCGIPADVSCICENNLFFCYKHAVEHEKKTAGKHKLISFAEVNLYKKCKLNLENIKQAKSKLIERSNSLIQSILSITKTQITSMVSNYNKIENFLKNEEFNDEISAMIDECGDVVIKDAPLDHFNEIVKNYLCVSVHGTEILPSAFNIVEALREFLRKEELAKEKIRKKVFQVKSESLLNSAKTFELDLRNMQTEIETYIKEFTKASISDKIIIENTLVTIVDLVNTLQQQSNMLRSAVSFEISEEEMVVINNDTTNLIPYLIDITQSCKSLLVMIKFIKDMGYLSSQVFSSLKITNDRQYYFFCNCELDCKYY